MIRLLGMLALILALFGVAAAGADPVGEALVKWAEPGQPLPQATDARALSLQFLEWEHLADWLRAELRGDDPGALPGRWARLRELRLDGAKAPEWERQRRARGLCLFEEMGLEAPALLLACDSLLVRRHDAVRYLYAGLIEAQLLALHDLPGCGRADDAAAALAEIQGDPPGLGLEELKAGRDYAALFFAAERVVEGQRVARLGRVREFLAQPGQLISLKYGFNAPDSLASARPPEQLDEEHWLYADGLAATWPGGHALRVDGLGVLHMPSQHLIQFVESDANWTLNQDGSPVQAPDGRFELSDETLLRGGHFEIALAGGRYRLDEAELRLWLPGGFLVTNRRELLFSLFLLVTIVFLLRNARQQRRRLAEPLQQRRPGRNP